MLIARVAVPAPLRRLFDYRVDDATPPPVGARVRVPFGRRHAVGVVMALAQHSDVPVHQLKRVDEVLDPEPLLPADLIDLLLWAARYYGHPPGEVVEAALPTRLRRATRPQSVRPVCWALTPGGAALEPSAFKRAPRQRELLEQLRAAPTGLARDLLPPALRPLLAAFAGRGLVAQVEPPAATVSAAEPVALNPAQDHALSQIVAAFGGFQTLVLHGVTGSGKTEVYAAASERCVARGEQVLLLVPEIGLTPQLVQRIEARLGVRVALYHSGLSEGERERVWLDVRAGTAALVIGTRSAVLLPFVRLGLVIVDEEHDASYKQQDGFRYHARDLAVLRASRARAPVVLGSATPSLDSLHKVHEGRYRLVSLPARAGPAALPAVRLLDLRTLPVEEGLSPPLVHAIAERLENGEQSLLFINRRGFAPVLFCRACRFVSACARCDAYLTWHRRDQRLRCHHCGAEQPAPAHCPRCGGGELAGVGEGTQRVEAALARRFPRASVVRIDRDSMGRKAAFDEVLARVKTGAAQILVGTQMLAKGHDFPRVTLVGVLNADQGLYAADFRAAEQLAQRLLQVAGRAGRAAHAGEVLIQTYHPTHPLFRAVAAHDYDAFARDALAEREAAGFPPYSHLAVLRAESVDRNAALAFLHRARGLVSIPSGVAVADPVPSPMERRAGRYRAQLLVQARARGVLHGFLNEWIAAIEASAASRRVRWSLDVDPVDLY